MERFEVIERPYSSAKIKKLAETEIMVYGSASKLGFPPRLLVAMARCIRMEEDIVSLRRGRSGDYLELVITVCHKLYGKRIIPTRSSVRPELNRKSGRYYIRIVAREA